MGRIRRIILFVFGLLQAGFGWFLWSATAFLTGRVGAPRSVDLAAEVIEALEANGGSIPDSNDLVFIAAAPIERELFARSDRPLLVIGLFAICGLVCMLIAAWPSRWSPFGRHSTRQP